MVQTKEQLKEYQKKYREKNKEKLKEYSLQYRKKNLNKIREKDKEYRKENYEKEKEKRKEYNKERRQTPGYKERMRNYQKEKRLNDPEHQIKAKVKNNMNRAFRRYTKTGKVQSSSKYGLDLKAIFQKLTPIPKSSEPLHIDHIRPLVSFKLEDDNGTINLKELKKAFAPENHQWLTAKENLSKGAKW